MSTLPDAPRCRPRAPSCRAGLPAHGTALLLLLLLTAPARAESPPTLTVGSLHLTACGRAGAYCGSLDRPLDPTGHVAGTLGVSFEFYPHQSPGPATGTLVAIEGGPGYATTGSREGYLALFAPLRQARDVVLVDSRGTGRSGALDCPALQQAPAITVADVGACGRSLGPRAPLYSTAYASDDLAAVLAALDAGPVDLYGDSYGTFSAQVFARRHPERLRSLTLDSAYPVDGPDVAWVASYAPAMRDKFNLACARSAPCRALPGSSLEHIAPALAALRRSPRTVRVLDADGHVLQFRADAAALATTMFGSAPSLTTVRELDAAARAFAGGDEAPLRRLMAEARRGTDSRSADHDVKAFSRAQSVAVMCQDAPQIYDMTLPVTARREQRAERLAARERVQPDLYAPFTFAEYRALPLDYAYLDECIEWPPPPPAHPPQALFASGAPLLRAPLLVLIGELDDITPPADGAAVVAAFPGARSVTLRNSQHVNAKPGARSDCGMAIVRHFIETLEPGDTRCAEAIAPLRLVAGFARHVREVPAAQALADNAASDAALRAATAAVRTLGDVIGRLESNSSGRGPGLRGGRFEVVDEPAGRRIRLHAVRFTTDLPVSGELLWSEEPSRGHALLEWQGPRALAGRVQVDWDGAEPEARAVITGTVGGAPLHATAPAP